MQNMFPGNLLILQMGSGGTITLSGGFVPKKTPQQKQGGGQARIGG